MPSNLNQPGESAPYRIFRAPRPEKKKETYEQLELPIKLARMKKRTNNNVNEA